MSIVTLRHYPWMKYWAGNWSLLTAAYFTDYYTQRMEQQLGTGLHRAVIIARKGYSACFFDADDRRQFGLSRAGSVLKSKKILAAFCATVKKKADHLVAHAERLRRKSTVTHKEYKKFFAEFDIYTGLHISPRNIIDHLPADRAASVVAPFTDVRLHTEKVYKKTEEFMEAWAAVIGHSLGYDGRFVLCALPKEIDRYFVTGKLPAKTLLSRRYTASAIICDRRARSLFIGRDVTRIEQALTTTGSSTEVKGSPAYPGRAIGTVRIVFDPKKAHAFNRGDILVTGMTRPEFLPLMVKAEAIVTDAGGILSHAAITAREMKKPCVIGTQHATRVFQDGDRVEVDAERGIVKKIP